MTDTIKPCPFCGHIGVSVHEASTFRWVVAECDYCGAQCGEVRRDTMKPSTEAEDRAKAIEEWNTRKVAALAAPQPDHVAISSPGGGDLYAEDHAVDRLSIAMKSKLASARARGRYGWDDPNWTPELISQTLREHVEKGDPVDVANYCMFLFDRKEAIL